MEILCAQTEKRVCQCDDEYNNNNVHLSCAPSTHVIHINLNTIFYTHVEDSPTRPVYIRHYIDTHMTTPVCPRQHLNIVGVLLLCFVFVLLVIFIRARCFII